MISALFLTFCLGLALGQNLPISTAEDCILDVSLVFDGTSSQFGMGIDDQKAFAKNLIDSMNIGPTKTRVAGFLIAGDLGGIKWDLSQGTDAATIKGLIDSQIDVVPGAGTDIGIVLEAKYDMYTCGVACGARDDVANACLLFSDGDTSMVDVANAMFWANQLNSLGAGSITAIAVAADGSSSATALADLQSIIGPHGNIHQVINLESEELITEIRDDLCETSIDDACRNCLSRNQKDYYAHPSDCTKYYHCYNNGTIGGVIGIERQCPEGTRWSEGAQNCVHKWSETCEDDPCENVDTMMEGFWQDPAEDQCGIFYQCSNYYSIKLCCPPNQRWNVTWGDCFWDSTCNSHNDDDCVLGGTPIPWLPPVIDGDECYEEQYDVTRKLHPDGDWKYYVVLTNHANEVKLVEKICAPGSRFELRTCKCSNRTAWDDDIVIPEDWGCILDIDCEPPLIDDKSAQNFYVDNNGLPAVSIVFGECAFNGAASLEVPGLQGNALGEAFTLRFLVTPSCDDGNGAIIHNRGSIQPPSEPSLLVRLSNYEIIAGVRTIKEDLLNTVSSSALTCAQTYHVALVWNKDTLILYINCEEVDSHDAQFESVVFWMNHCPLVIGNDGTYGGFTGTLDNIRLCREAFSADHISGDCGF